MRQRGLAVVGGIAAAIVIGVGSWFLAVDHSEITALRAKVQSSGIGHQKLIAGALLAEAKYIRTLQNEVAVDQENIRTLQTSTGLGVGQGVNAYALAQGLNSQVTTLGDSVQTLQSFMGCIQQSESFSWGSFSC